MGERIGVSDEGWALIASDHIAGNTGIDPMSLPAYQAVADHLMRKMR